MCGRSCCAITGRSIAGDFRASGPSPIATSADALFKRIGKIHLRAGEARIRPMLNGPVCRVRRRFLLLRRRRRLHLDRDENDRCDDCCEQRQRKLAIHHRLNVHATLGEIGVCCGLASILPEDTHAILRSHGTRMRSAGSKTLTGSHFHWLKAGSGQARAPAAARTRIFDSRGWRQVQRKKGGQTLPCTPRPFRSDRLTHLRASSFSSRALPASCGRGAARSRYLWSGGRDAPSPAAVPAPRPPPSPLSPGASTAIEQGVTVVPVLNKIDLPSAEPERVIEEIEDIIGIDAQDALLRQRQDRRRRRRHPRSGDRARAAAARATPPRRCRR